MSLSLSNYVINNPMNSSVAPGSCDLGKSSPCKSDKVIIVPVVLNYVTIKTTQISLANKLVLFTTKSTSCAKCDCFFVKTLIFYVYFQLELVFVS